jgi:hypothetical protein
LAGFQNLIERSELFWNEIEGNDWNLFVVIGMNSQIVVIVSELEVRVKKLHEHRF